MSQRKLTDHERRQASEARVHVVNMCRWGDLSDGPEYWHGVSSRLSAMVEHGTTDGNPWIEPTPPIPDGYRLAVAGEESRTDCKFWSLGLGVWKMRTLNNSTAPFSSDNIYIVPVDRVPTDEDAKSRPVVMVRDRNNMDWEKQTLVFVNGRADAIRKFVAVDSFSQSTDQWKFCRYPYPNEQP